ncbi:unnamed protein product [Staurois parvus]|uniref:Uncharacterized protein n=1 Tax=Staurois parvus TaxID=386267 RepID=A0ABN9G744_9NEOB|nr:unnamed protein product [Staurois parvus]
MWQRPGHLPEVTHPHNGSERQWENRDNDFASTSEGIMVLERLCTTHRCENATGEERTAG